MCDSVRLLLFFFFLVISDQGKPGEPGHRNIGRGSCRSALGCRGME